MHTYPTTNIHIHIKYTYTYEYQCISSVSFQPGGAKRRVTPPCGIVQGDCRLRVAGSNSHRFMFPLAIAALGPIVRVLLSAAVALQMTSFDLLCLFGLQVKHSRRCEKDVNVKRCHKDVNEL